MLKWTGRPFWANAAPPRARLAQPASMNERIAMRDLRVIVSFPLGVSSNGTLYRSDDGNRRKTRKNNFELRFRTPLDITANRAYSLSGAKSQACKQGACIQHGRDAGNVGKQRFERSTRAEHQLEAAQ